MAKKVDNTREENMKDKATDKDTGLVTKETLCALFAVFSLLVFVILCTGNLVFGDIGIAVRSFMTGVFGYYAYPLLLLVCYASICGLFDKRLIKNRKAVRLILLSALFGGLLVHTALTFNWDLSSYAHNAFLAGASFPAATVTGWAGGLLIALLASVFSKTGAIIVFAVTTIAFAYFAYKSIKKFSAEKASTAKEEVVSKQQPLETEIPLTIPVKNTVQVAQPTQPTVVEAMPKQEAEPTYYRPVDAPQRPAFTIANDGNPAPTKQAGTSFSPFGATEFRAEDDRDTEYAKARDMLFNTTPQESYQKNLIFDPNSRVNRRPIQSAVEKTVISDGYTPSYTDAYQNSLNAQSNRPIKIVSDQTQGQAYRSQEEDLTPLAPIETHRFETPAATPHMIDASSGESSFLDEPTTPYSKVEEPETPRSNPRHEYMDLFSANNPNVFGNSDSDRAFARDTFGDRSEPIDFGRDTFIEEPARDGFREIEEPTNSRFVEVEEPVRSSGIDIFGDDDDEDTNSLYTLNAPVENQTMTSRFLVEDEPQLPSRDRFEDTVETVKAPMPPAPPIKPVPTPPTPPAPPKPRIIRPYVRMPIDDFDCRDVEPSQDPEQVEQTKRTIIATLEDFKVTDATIASVTFGPTVTRYNVAIPGYISPKKVFTLDEPLAMRLHSPEVSISPNYENGVISVEVPNEQRQFVNLGSMLTGDTYVNASPSSLMFTMGKDVGNRKVYGDISKMIHMLVAGSSGAGKSVFLGSLIISLIHKYSPEELRLILIDPKKTEFVIFNDLPHLMINEIITDANKAIQSLNWAIGEMNHRYTLFEQMSRKGTYVQNLDQYNSHVEKAEKLPKIVIIIDELADLMLAAKKDVEDRIQNLTQKARAAGIHLVVATQRPSTDVITGVIKSNLSTRIAFSVATEVDSRVILDQSGAQKLLGKGDFLYTMQGIKTPVRVQSAFINADDMQRVVNFIKANNEAYFDENATAFINNARGAEGGGDGYSDDGEVEPVFIEALRFAILSKSASISLIQRKCAIGYNKAGRIVEWMEEMGYISSFDGAKARKVLITPEEFESKYGPLS